jgi:hypothetical protein
MTYRIDIKPHAPEGVAAMTLDTRRMSTTTLMLVALTLRNLKLFSLVILACEYFITSELLE